MVLCGARFWQCDNAFAPSCWTRACLHACHLLSALQQHLCSASWMQRKLTGFCDTMVQVRSISCHLVLKTRVFLPPFTDMCLRWALQLGGYLAERYSGKSLTVVHVQCPSRHFRSSTHQALTWLLLIPHPTTKTMAPLVATLQTPMPAPVCQSSGIP